MRKLVFLLLFIPLIGFSQISETDVTTNAIEAALSESTNDLKLLCISSSVNSWSRKKPVRIHNASPSTWWLANDGKLGFNIPTGTVGNEASYDLDTWEYIKPNDANSYREGDFRGYYHAMYPTVVINGFAPDTVNLHTDASQVFSWSKFTNSTLSIQFDEFPTNYGQYYFGVRIRHNDRSATGEETIWVASTDSVYHSTIEAITVDMSDSPFSGTTGDYYFDVFITNDTLAQTSSLSVDQQSRDMLMLPDGTFQTIGVKITRDSFNLVNTAPFDISGFELTLFGSGSPDYTDFAGSSTNKNTSSSDATWKVTLTSNTGEDLDDSPLTFKVNDAYSATSDPAVVDLGIQSWTGAGDITTSGTTFNSTTPIKSWSDVQGVFGGGEFTNRVFTYQFYWNGVAITGASGSVKLTAI